MSGTTNQTSGNSLGKSGQHTTASPPPSPKKKVKGELEEPLEQRPIQDRKLATPRPKINRGTAPDQGSSKIPTPGTKKPGEVIPKEAPSKNSSILPTTAPSPNTPQEASPNTPTAPVTKPVREEVRGSTTTSPVDIPTTSLAEKSDEEVNNEDMTGTAAVTRTNVPGEGTPAGSTNQPPTVPTKKSVQPTTKGSGTRASTSANDTTTNPNPGKLVEPTTSKIDAHRISSSEHIWTKWNVPLKYLALFSLQIKAAYNVDHRDYLQLETNLPGFNPAYLLFQGLKVKAPIDAKHLKGLRITKIWGIPMPNPDQSDDILYLNVETNRDEIFVHPAVRVSAELVNAKEKSKGTRDRGEDEPDGIQFWLSIYGPGSSAPSKKKVSAWHLVALASLVSLCIFGIIGIAGWLNKNPSVEAFLPGFWQNGWYPATFVLGAVVLGLFLELLRLLADLAFPVWGMISKPHDFTWGGWITRFLRGIGYVRCSPFTMAAQLFSATYSVPNKFFWQFREFVRGYLIRWGSAEDRRGKDVMGGPATACAVLILVLMVIVVGILAWLTGLFGWAKGLPWPKPARWTMYAGLLWWVASVLWGVTEGWRTTKV